MSWQEVPLSDPVCFLTLSYICSQSVSCTHLRFQEVCLKAFGQRTTPCDGLQCFFQATNTGADVLLCFLPPVIPKEHRSVGL